MLSSLSIQAYACFQRKWCQACDGVLSNHIPSFRPMYVPNPSATNHFSQCRHTFFPKSMVHALDCTILYLKHPLLQDPQKWKKKIRWKVHISGNSDDKGLRCLLMNLNLLPTRSPPYWLTWVNAHHYQHFPYNIQVRFPIQSRHCLYTDKVNKRWSSSMSLFVMSPGSN